MNPISEQRQNPRRTSYIIVEYTVMEGTFRDIIKNISAGGMLIETNREIAVAQVISTKFPLFDFDNIIEVYGRVARKDHDGYVVKFNEPIEGLICKKGYFPEIVHELER